MFVQRFFCSLKPFSDFFGAKVGKSFLRDEKTKAKSPKRKRRFAKIQQHFTQTERHFITPKSENAVFSRPFL